jgi:hypothetical protein
MVGVIDRTNLHFAFGGFAQDGHHESKLIVSSMVAIAVFDASVPVTAAPPVSQPDVISLIRFHSGTEFKSGCSGGVRECPRLCAQFVCC